jgi:hypothetical protein
MKPSDPSITANEISLVIDRLGGGSSFHRFSATAMLTLMEGWLSTSANLYQEGSQGNWVHKASMVKVSTVKGVKDEDAHGSETWVVDEFTATGTGPFRFKATAQLASVMTVDDIAQWP